MYAQRIYTFNKTQKVYSLQYREIPMCSSRHITDDDDKRTAKGITNATMISKETMVSKVTVEIM
jgi:hypothetical protein